MALLPAARLILSHRRDAIRRLRHPPVSTLRRRFHSRKWREYTSNTPVSTLPKRRRHSGIRIAFGHSEIASFYGPIFKRRVLFCRNRFAPLAMRPTVGEHATIAAIATARSTTRIRLPRGRGPEGTGLLLPQIQGIPSERDTWRFQVVFFEVRDGCVILKCSWGFG